MTRRHWTITTHQTGKPREVEVVLYDEVAHLRGAATEEDQAMKVAKLVDSLDSALRWWCPGCDCNHVVPIAGPIAWGFNGDLERPTRSPSVLVHSHRSLIDPELVGDALTMPSNVAETPTCHSIIRNGRIDFLSDCTHSLAGQTVPMGPVHS